MKHKHIKWSSTMTPKGWLDECTCGKLSLRPYDRRKKVISL